MRKTTILLLGLSVAACSVGPDFERPELYSDQEIQKTRPENRSLRESQRGQPGYHRRSKIVSSED